MGVPALSYYVQKNLPGGDFLKKADIEKLVLELVSPIVFEAGLMLEDVSFDKEGKDYFLRVYIDKENGVDITDCENVSRKLSDALDVADPIAEPYMLEVSSPGLDRPLKKPEDYVRFKGRKVDVKLFSPIKGEKLLNGILLGREGDKVFISCGEDITLEFSNIAWIKLAVEF